MWRVRMAARPPGPETGRLASGPVEDAHAPAGKNDVRQETCAPEDGGRRLRPAGRPPRGKPPAPPGAIPGARGLQPSVPPRRRPAGFDPVQDVKKTVVAGNPPPGGAQARLTLIL